MGHITRCQCRGCQIGIEAFIKENNELIKQHGFTTWYALEAGPDYPNGVDIRTRGLYRTYGHLNLQICMPISPKVAHEIFWRIVDQIKSGKVFKAGVPYPDIVAGGYNVTFINAIEGGRPVLRLLVCDKNGGYEGEAFQAQFSKLNN